MIFLKVSVSERALFQRIQRKLAKENKKICRGRKAHPELGAYYIIDLSTSLVVEYPIDDIERLAREINTLAEYESLSDEMPKPKIY